MGPLGCGEGASNEGSWGQGHSLGKLVLPSHHPIFAAEPALNPGTLTSSGQCNRPALSWVGGGALDGDSGS